MNEEQKVIEIEMTEDEYEEYLNEMYDDIEIGQLVFQAGDIVRRLDPIAFRCGLSDEPIRYQCAICGSEFSDYEEAEECHDTCNELCEEAE